VGFLKYANKVPEAGGGGSGFFFEDDILEIQKIERDLIQRYDTISGYINRYTIIRHNIKLLINNC
jgi:hypothetical protein